MESHVFNERLKVLQPVDKTCMCCGKNLSTGKDDYYQLFYKEDGRTNIVVFRSVSYREIGIGVSHCHECKMIQKKAKTQSIFRGYGMGLGIILVTSLIGCLLMRTNLYEAVGIILILVGILAGWIVGRMLYKRSKSKICKQHGILPVEEAMMNYELVGKLLDEGWTTKMPVA